jgi:hypothetical protein
VAESRFQLGQALRETGRADEEAIEQLERAAHLSPSTPRYWRELGVALSKFGRPGDAVPALQRGIDLDPSDFDAISALGGAHRRLALAEAPMIDWDHLQAARESYERASKLSPRDTYPLLNVARIDLLLSHLDPARGHAAKAFFVKVLPLCQFEWQDARDTAAAVEADWGEKQNAGYKAFDYADCLLFSGHVQEGVEAYRNAINSVPVELRQDIFRSVVAGLASIDATARLDEVVAEAVTLIRSLLGGGHSAEVGQPGGE